MYYLRTKSAVDAIKFTLNNDKKAEPVLVEAEVASAPAKKLAPNVSADVEPIDVNDFKAMLQRAQSAEPDDCEMCGS